MAAARDVIDLTIVTMGTNKTPRGFADWKEQIMKLIICTKFHVNPMNFVESRRGAGPIDPPPPPSSVRVTIFSSPLLGLIIPFFLQL